MADTRAATGLTVQEWDDKFFTEYFQENRFTGEMGANENSIIQVKEALGKKPGDSVTYALVNKLQNDAVTGSDMLEGNEEDMSSRSFRLYVDKRRNATRVSEMEEQKSAISLREAGRAVLMDWAQEDTKNQLITYGLESINGVAYASATEAQKDAWLLDNLDRVQFGALRSNTDLTGGADHSASLANIDNTADKFTAAAVSLLKRLALAKRSDGKPKIRPVKDQGNGKRYFVIYAHPLCFRDLKNDATITAAQREVGLAMENSRLFEGGDILWDNCIIKEVDDFNAIASSIQVGRAVLCGAQAMGAAYCKRWRSRTKEFDYGDKYGIAVDGIMGFRKLIFGTNASSDTGDTIDHGVVTGYFAAVADA